MDTVGAGDSFLATLLNHLLNKAHPQDALSKAFAVGAMVAGSKGANPILTTEHINDFMKAKKP